MKTDYKQKANNLAIAIDIAVESFQKFTNADWDESNLQHMIDLYLSWKKDILASESSNKKNLSFMEDVIFTPFQEGSGKDVDYFWSQINLNQLNFKRKNKLVKILKRKKIKNRIEYDFVIDVMVPYKQEGLITDEEMDVLSQLIADFESNPKNKA